MTKKYLFAEWLKCNRNIKNRSIQKYISAIDTISSELQDYGLVEIDLYNLVNTEFIDAILINPVFNQKDERGHRMYSVALNHYKKFLEVE